MKKLILFVVLPLFLLSCSNPDNPGLVEISSFIFPAAENEALTEDIAAEISGTDISALFPAGTDVTSLSATAICSTGAVVSPDPAIARDYTDPVSFTVTAEDNVTTNTYTITANVALRTESLISSFNFYADDNTALTEDVTGIFEDTVITAHVPSGTGITSLTPVIIISDGASVLPASGAVQDFSSPVTYTVTAEDGTSTSYITAVHINPTASGLISYWPYNNNANDVSGNNNNGTLSGAIFIADRHDNSDSACDFNGTTGMMQTTTDYNTDFTALSVSLWFKTDSTSGGGMFGHALTQDGNTVDGDKRIYISDAGEVFTGINNGGIHIINTSGAYNDGDWHHLAALYTSAKMELYIDNTSAALDESGYGLGETARYWLIGYENFGGGDWASAPANYYFDGALDDIRVYDRALSTSEIAELYNE